MSLPLPPSIDDLGRYHRLGETGPAYEVIGPLQPIEAEGDWLMKILILEIGEEVTYRASDIRDDPDADHVATTPPGARH